MKTSDQGRKFIEEFESLFLHAYDDLTEKIVGPNDHVRGTLTIGYGHTSAAGKPDVYSGMTISREEADQILSSDLSKVEANVSHLCRTVQLTQNQFDALVSFDFNTGGLERSSALRDVLNGHLSLVPGDLNMWVKSKGQVLKGLIRRRKAEGLMFSRGVYNAYPTNGESYIASNDPSSSSSNQSS